MIQRYVALVALLAFSLHRDQAAAQAQNEEDFQCGVPSVAPALDLGGKEFDFDSIEPRMECGDDESFLIPSAFTYHIYAIPDGDIPRLSMYPEGLVQPVVTGSTLELNVQDILKGMGRGDRVKAAVNLYVPVSQLKKVILDGVDTTVEIINTIETTSNHSMTIKDSGVDNVIYLTSPYSKVSYDGSGVDSMMQMIAAAGSSIVLSGVDQVVKVKTEGDDLMVDMSGVDQDVYVQGGGFQRLSMSGVDNSVYINGGSCNNVDKSGVDNSCSISDATFTVPTMACLESSKVGKCHGCDGISKVIAILAGFLILGCCGSCIFGIAYCTCYRNRRNRYDNEEIKNPQPPAVMVPNQMPSYETKLGEKEKTTGPPTGVVEAEIISVEEGASPHSSVQKSKNIQVV
jgi:hypothetical protein